jgi:hypothetical protein
LHGGERKKEEGTIAIEMKLSALGFAILWKFKFSSTTTNLSSKEFSP